MMGRVRNGSEETQGKRERWGDTFRWEMLGDKRAAWGKGKDFFVKVEGIVRKAFLFMESTRERQRFYMAGEEENGRLWEQVLSVRKRLCWKCCGDNGEKIPQKAQREKNINGRAENIFRRHWRESPALLMKFSYAGESICSFDVLYFSCSVTSSCHWNGQAKQSGKALWDGKGKRW